MSGRVAEDGASLETLVSVTRFRARSLLLVPLFLLHARRAIAQLQQSEGYLAGALRPHGNGTFWTMSVWRDAHALKAYVSSGAHRVAMPRLAAWAMEASVVRWVQPGHDLPDWEEAVRRMREDGRPSELRRPGPHHADLSFTDPHEGRGLRL